MPGIYTDRLNIRRVQPTDYFISDTFNAILDDIDSKVLGLDHLETALHWTEWEEGTAYEANDVVRWRGMKSHQYAKCLVGGVSGSTEPGNNVTGSVLTDGTVRWKVMSLTEATDTTGFIVLWLGGVQYSRGDVVLYADALYRAKIDHTASSTFEADDGYWQEIYASVRKWLRQKYYYLDDTVIVGNTIYRCILAHTSANTFDDPAETPCWSVVGNLARVLEWSGNIQYFAGQVITKNGLMYRSLLDHVSDVDFSVDASNWELVYASIIPWTPNAWYKSGAVVYYNNILYRCTTSHTSTAVFNPTNWTMLHDPNAFVRSWVSGQHYYQNQLVYHNNNIYKCNVENSDTAFDIGKWILITDSINDWASSIDYVVGQYVYYDGALYKCITANNDVTFTNIKWQKISGGGLATWTSNKEYIVGDVVINAGKIYQCNTAHTSSSSFNTDTNNWTEISACITRIPNWTVNTEYVVGDLVAHDAKIYRCTTAHTSDPTQWNNTEEANWEELSPTINEISSWAVSTDYEIGQLVIHDNKLYRCNTAHTSDSTSFNTDIAYWDAIGSTGIDIWRANEAYTTSNVVIYNNKIYKCNTAHTSGSTFDPTKWDEISSADIGLWQPSTDYRVGNVVIKDNQIYRCITSHTSDSSDFYTDIANWAILDTKWISNNWTASTYYRVGEVVLYANTLYKCNTEHTSLSTFELDKADWQILNANIRTWSSGNTYKSGDIVYKDGELKRCITSNDDIVFSGQKWSTISKCNIEIWREGPNQDILALLHFDNQSDKYHNEYGNNFAPYGGNNTEFQLVDSYGGSAISVIGGDGYVVNINSLGSMTSPDYTFTNNETYTIEFYAHIQNSDSDSGETLFWTIGGIGNGSKNVLSVGNVLFSDVVDDNGNSVSFTYESLSIDFSQFWHHFAYMIDDTTCTLYIDGNQVSSFTRANSDPISFKSIHGNSSSIYCFIDELRITKDEVYTSSFTPSYNKFAEPNYDGYDVDDLVVYDDKIYRCITANSDFVFDTNKWVEVSPSIGVPYWTAGEDYPNNTVVLYGRNLYRAITNVVNATDNPQISSDYQLLSPPIIEPYASGQNYSPNQAIIKDNNLYVAKQSIINSSSTFDPTEWTQIGGIKQWYSGGDYKSGEYVVYNNSLYRVVNDVNNASSNPKVSNDYVAIGGGDLNLWVTNTDYYVGDIVIKDNQLYRCVTNHTSGTFTTDISNWDMLDIKWLAKNWASSTYYAIGEIVLNNGYMYRCTIAHTSSTFSSDVNNWSVIANPTIVNDWQSSTNYFNKQLVEHDGVLYRSNSAHTSSSSISSDDSKLDLVYANLRSWASNTYYRQGSIVINNGNIYRCINSHTSVSSMFVVELYNGTGGISANRPSDSAGDTTVTTNIIDLGSSYNINKLYFTLYTYNTCFNNIDFYISNDNVNYATLASWTASGSWQQTSPITLNVDGTGRYVKVVGSNLIYTFRPQSTGMSNLVIYTDSNNWERIGMSSADYATDTDIDSLFN